MWVGAGGERGPHAPWGRGPAAKRETGHQTFMQGVAVVVQHPVLGRGRQSRQPAAGLGRAGQKGLEELTSDG